MQKLYLIITIISLGICSAVSAFAQERETEFLLSSRIAEGSDVSYVKKLESGILSLDKNASFSVKARITPTTEAREVLFEQTKLDLPQKSQKCFNPPCTWTWQQDLAEMDISIMDRPKLELAWEQAKYGKTPKVTVKAEFSSGDSRQGNSTCKLTGTFLGYADPAFQTYKTIDMKEAAYTEKSKWYLAKRELGLNSDQKWRHSRDGGNLVLQRRVDIPLSNATGIQIVAQDQYVPKIINISLDTDGNGLRDDFILDQDIDKKIEPNGQQTVLTLDLRGALKKKDIDSGQAVLMEPILFMPMNFNRYNQIQPIKTIAFGNLGDQNQDTVQPDVLRTENEYSLIFDFSKQLNQSGMWDAKYKDLQVRAETTFPQVVHWNKCRLFSSFQDQVPKVLLEPVKALSNWEINAAGEGRFQRLNSFEPVYYAKWEKNSTASNASDSYYSSSNNYHFDASKYISKGAASINEWYKSDGIHIQDSLYYYMSGLRKVMLQLSISSNNGGYKRNIALYGSSGKIPFVSPEDKIKKLRLIEWEANKELQSQESIRLVLFNLQYADTYSMNGTTRWWVKHKNISGLPGSNTYLDKGSEIVYLLTENNPSKTWYFDLTSCNFLNIRKISSSEKDSQECKFKIMQNNKTVGAKKINTEPSLNFIGSTSDIEVKIQCTGDEPFYKVLPPELEIFGGSESLTRYLEKLNINIGDISLSFNLTPEQISQGDWIQAGDVELGSGNYTFSIKDNEFFHIDSVLLETKNKLYDLEEIANEQKENTSGIASKLKSLGLKLLILIAIGLGLYVFRQPTKRILSKLSRKFGGLIKRWYWFFPDKVWAVIWFFLSGILYYAALMSPAQGGGNAASFAGICAVLFYWHVMRILKKHIEQKFPRLASHVYYSNSKIFFAGAIMFLIGTAILVALHLEPLAEQLAVIVYYFLVAGVVGEIVSLKKEDHTNEAEEIDRGI